MFGILAYNGSAPAAAVDFDVPAVPDPQTTANNGHFLWTEDKKLYAAYGLATSITRLKMVTPHYRALSIPDVWPLERNTQAPNRANLATLNGYYPTIPATEELQFLLSNSAGAPENSDVFVWVGDGNMSIPTGPVYSIHGITTVTAVANQWTLGALALDQTLPQGRYAIVGMEASNATLVAARIVLPGYSHRPGVITGANAGVFPSESFLPGKFGVWGEFVNTAIPSIELYSAAAGATTAQVILSIIKIQ